MASIKAFEKYVRRGHRSVNGWLNDHSARFIAELSRLQTEKSVSGSVAEIGVHHGRLFILLHLALQPSERSVVIDIFGDQEMNIDQSGKGDRGIFLSNLKRHGGSADRATIIQQSSLTVSAQQVIDAGGKVRLFSVDGGHTTECALNDLRLAEACLVEGGVIILDDFFNEYWPEVCVATFEYLSGPSALKPFAVTPNKLYLASPDWAQTYNEGMRKRLPSFEYDKTVSMFGSEVSVYGVYENMIGLPIKLARRLVATGPGQRLRAWGRRR